MYNIQKAVSRLNFAPKLKEIEVTDIKKGLAVFMPKADKPVSFAAVKSNLKQAGYTLATADITVEGKLVNEGGKWFVVSNTSNQRFELQGTQADAMATKAGASSSVEVIGNWTTDGTRELIDPVTITPKATSRRPTNDVRFINASFGPSAMPSDEAEPEAEAKKRAPIRTTSPGLTVFKGGAFTPRVYFVKQHLGDVDVHRQILDLSISYTPSPHLQLELQAPFSRTSFHDTTRSGSGWGFGNVTAWAKYRFYRKVKTYGDHQAAARLGLELPTGKSSFPTAAQVNAPAFVRAQLGSINGGLAPHFDVSFSQAGGRVIFGGNAEGILRTERNGFRVGHELKLNTDLEYVITPPSYPKPGGELFLILESSLVTRTKGRINGLVAPGSSSTEYYLSPGLQYAARPTFVVEGSIQLPVWRHDGPQVLRTDYNLLLGIKWLF